MQMPITLGAQMTTSLPAELSGMVGVRTISADDASLVRKAVYAAVEVTDQEAGWLFALSDAAAEACPEFDALFVEALTDFCVHQMEPRGYVSEENARWLMDRIAADGNIHHAREMELLVAILQKSTKSPEFLATFALKTVRDAVLSGSGPLRGRQKDFRPKVCATDVDLLQRCVFAFGAGGNVAVTREEAELLCDINDATLNAANDPGWAPLFAKAIANHLMMAATYTPPSRDDAAARDKWLNDQSVNVGGFFGKMANSFKDAFKSKDPEQDFWDAYERQREAAVRSAQTVTEDEGVWLAVRINRDGKLSAAEEALLRFIKADGAPVHASLKPLMDRVA
jgi:hypothetical protein